MRRAALVAVALGGCAHDATMGGGSHGMVSYGGGGGGYSSSASSSGSSSSYGAEPSSHGASDTTQVYRSSATGAPVARSSAKQELETGGGKTGGPQTENKRLRAGLITLGISYVTTVAIAQYYSTTFGDFEHAVGADGTVDRLWIPVLGPWSALAYNLDHVSTQCDTVPTMPQFMFYNCNELDAANIAIYIGGLAQTIGFGMTMYALLKPPTPHAKHEEKRFVLVPHGSPTSTGLTLTGSF